MKAIKLTSFHSGSPIYINPFALNSFREHWGNGGHTYLDVNGWDGIEVVEGSEMVEELFETATKTTLSERKGVWRHYEGELECSMCKARFYDNIMEHCGDDVPHYCPDCGADMKGTKPDE